VFRSILDPQFKYRNAASTNLRETFDRIRREQGLNGSSATQSLDHGSGECTPQQNVRHFADMRRRRLGQ
jgi:hypothetical protein